MSDEKWPLDDRQKTNIRGVGEQIKEIDDLTGGWTCKAEARRTGLSLYVRFEKKVDVTVSMRFLNMLESSPGMLVDACERLLAAAEAQD